MKKVYNVAFFGAGAIAGKVAETLQRNHRLYLYAVASRSKEHADIFAQKYGVDNVFASYEEMLKDDAIDFVYVSTPTKCHYENIKNCLLANKNVICEKPLVGKLAEAEELIELARERHLLLVDALWTMYMPIMERIKREIGNLGSVKYASASLGYPSLIHENGSVKTRYELWDYEIYPLATMLYLFGEPLEVTGKTRYLKANYAVNNCSKLAYGKQRIRIYSSLKHRSSYVLVVKGTKGILVSRKWWFGNYPVYIWKFPFKITKINFQHENTGYEYEFDEMIKCLDSGKIESVQYSFEKTLSVLRWKEKLKIDTL